MLARVNIESILGKTGSPGEVTGVDHLIDCIKSLIASVAVFW